MNTSRTIVFTPTSTDMSMTPQQILEEAARVVAVRAGDSYGPYEKSLSEIAVYWRVYLMVRGDKTDLGPLDVALMMVLLKLARAKASPGYVDNYIDIAGYAALAGGLGGADTKN